MSSLGPTFTLAMPDLHFAPLPHRGLIAVRGDDRGAFLQGLVSNDVRKVEAGLAAWAAFLTPQGKFLHEFFMFGLGNAIWLECERERRADLIAQLSKFKLRAKVQFDAVDELAVGAAWGRNVTAAFGLRDESGMVTALGAGVVFVDPRLKGAGVRWSLLAANAPDVLGELGLQAALPSDYDRWRVSLGLPDGSRDMEVEKAILLENGFDELGGLDWDKGCYLGQELTARTHYRGLIRKRLLPVGFDADPPEPGADVMQDGKPVGVVRSVGPGCALVLLRLDALAPGAGDLLIGSTTVTPQVPGWVKLPEQTSASG
ncbi:MAG: folate-binding protein YgfZ [Rhodobacteraceae bacterium]|nr:folate-binding protein YgfZ [Paracoccaceae bacterium]